MVKLSAREPRKAGPSEQANLENDTEKRETRHRAEVRRSFGRRGARRPDGTVRFEELNAESEGKRVLWRAPEERKTWRRIKHQSLILAQDERWRRA